MATWYQIGPLLTKIPNAYIGFPPGGEDGPTGFRAGDAIQSDMVDGNPFVIGVGTKISSGEWVRYSFPYNYSLIKGMPAFVSGRDECFIWTVSLEFTIPGANAGTVIRQLPPVPPVTETPKTPVASIYNTTGRVIPYSKGFRRLQGAKIWLQGIEGGATALVDSAYGTWAESFGYPLHPGEDIFVQTIWFDGNKVWDKDDGFLIDGLEFTFNFYSGTETQEPDPNIVLDKGANRTPAFRGHIYIVFINAPLATSSNRIPSTTTVEIQPTDQNRITVSGALEDVGVLGEVPLTVTGIDDDADGVVFANGLNPRSILQTYADQYNYRIIDGNPIRVVRRALNDDFTIDLELTAADFASKDASDPVVTPKRADASTLPNQIELTYTDRSQNYQQGTQYARRPIFPVPAVTASGVQTLSTEFIITAVEALSIAYDLLYRLWAQQLTAPFTLIAQRSAVEEADVLSAPTSQGSFVMEVVRRTLNPDDTTDVEMRYLLSANGAALTADAGDVNGNPLRKPYVYPGILAWSARDTGLGFVIPSDPPGFFISDGQIVAFAPGFGGVPYGSLLPAGNQPMLTIAPPTIPSTISARSTVDLSIYNSTLNGDAICDDANYWYMADVEAGNIRVLRIAKSDRTLETLDTGVSTGFVGIPAFLAAGQGRIFIGYSRHFFASGDNYPPELIVVDASSFDLAGVSVIPLTGLDMSPDYPRYSSGVLTGMAIAGGAVLLVGIAYNSTADSITPSDQRIWRYSIADGTLDSAFLSTALGAGVGSNGVAFFLPFTESGLNDTVHTTGAIIDAASFAISFVDLAADDTNVIHIHSGHRPWADADRFYFLANNGKQTGDSHSTINDPYLIKRNRDGSSDGGVDLTFYYDNVTFNLDVGCCDENFHYLHGMANGGIPSRGPGCILRVAKDASYATFYPARQAPPSNDDFVKATGLKLAVAPTKFDNQYATKETGEPDHHENAGGHSVWFSFTPQIGQTYTVTINDGQATSAATVAVYKGDSLAALNEIVSVLQVGHTLAFKGAAGTAYRIAIDGKYDPDTLFTDFAPGSIKITGAPTATNDDFEDAIAIAVGETKTGDNTFASKQTGEPDHGGNPGGKSLWWTFTADNDHTIRITTDDSDIPTAIGVYTGDSVDALTEVASAADAINPTDDDWTAWSVTR